MIQLSIQRLIDVLLRLIEDGLEESQMCLLSTMSQVLSLKDPASISVTFPCPQTDSHIEIWQGIKTLGYGHSLQTFEFSSLISFVTNCDGDSCQLDYI